MAARKSTSKKTQSASVVEASPKKPSRPVRSETGDWKDMLRDLAANPTVRYVAGGLAAAMLAKFSTKMTDRYPEISSFLKENFPDLDEKIDRFRNSENLSEARH